MRILRALEIKISLPCDTGIAALCAVRRLFKQHYVGAEIVRRDGRCETCRAETNHDHIGFHVPVVWN